MFLFCSPKIEPEMLWLLEQNLCSFKTLLIDNEKEIEDSQKPHLPLHDYKLK